MPTGIEPAPAAGRVQGGLDRVRPLGVAPESWFDPMVAVAASHAGLLIGVGEREHPLAIGATTAALIVWHLAVRWLAPSGISWLLRDAGSHVAAAVVVALDGGTESPFFFWVLLFLAGQALRHPAERFFQLAALAIGSYVVAMLATETTAASIGRLGLLVAFCAVMAYLRRMLDREAAEARQVDSTMRTAFEAAPVGILLLNGSLETVYANAPAHRLIDRIGIQEEEVTVITATRGPMGLTDALTIGLGEPMSGPELVRIEIEQGHRDVRVLSVPVVVEGSRHVLVFTEDVTELVAAGEERIRFLQAAAHQFRTPLTPIMGYASLLADGGMDRLDIEEAAQAIHSGASRLEQLLDRLAMLLNLRSSIARPSQTVAVEEVIEAARAACVEGQVDAVGDLSALISCDPESTALGLEELMRNGIIHGVEPVRLRVVAGDPVVIRIDDAGSGPPLEGGAPLERMWSAVYAGNVVSAHMGSQLGLSQAFSLLHLGGAELTFERSGSDWCFRVAFAPAG